MPRAGNILACALAVAVSAGCAASLDGHPGVPEALVEKAKVHNIENVRFWGDSRPGVYDSYIRQRIALARKMAKSGGGAVRHQDILTISGGGSDGAFGAGLLAGWSEHGTRPQFHFVTGISTGAMTAPMAFLGPKYDAKLKEAYTTASTEDIATPQVLAALVGASNSLASTKPLERQIEKFMTAEMLREIAEEHRKGRILMIGTTNLEAQRSVIWDIGALAASGHPEALALTRKIILASAAIPGAFPPVEIDVVADGKRYREMHVDGGVTRQVFLYPPGVSPTQIDGAVGWKMQRRVYIIRNAKVTPEYQAIPDKILPIATRSIATLIKTQGIGDLYEIATVAKRDNVDYNLAYIPTSFSVPSRSDFDPVYMLALYEEGFRLGRDGFPWKKSPPGFE